ncbi:MAG: carboxypeptidase regulatory-like domain-containing protein [Planctomycetota bacterium]
MKKRSMSAALSAALSLWLCGCTTTVEGYVREEGTESGIAGATVQVGDRTTTTDSRGHYKLEVDPDEDVPQRVYVDAPRHKSVSKSMVVAGDPDPLAWNVELPAKEEEKTKVQVEQKMEQPKGQAEAPKVNVEQNNLQGAGSSEGSLPAGHARPPRTRAELRAARAKLEAERAKLASDQAALDRERDRLQREEQRLDRAEKELQGD